jgi:hypothetical protein
MTVPGGYSNPADNFPPVGPPPYVMPSNPDNLPNYPTIFPPPAQALSIAYLAPRLAPIPVATRVPQPSNIQDSVNGFVRVEAAGGSILIDDCLFNVGIIVHSYSVNDQESQAEINMMHALAHMGNAQGRFIVHPSLQRPWYVTYSRITALGVKQADPLVNMVRFRGMVTWRIKGQNDPLNEPNDSLQ